VTELEGNAVTITDTNFRGLQELCNELGFSDLTAKLWAFHPSIGWKEAKQVEDAEARGRIAALEEQMEQHGREIAFSQDELRQFATDFRRLPGEVSTLRSEVSALKTQIALLPDKFTQLTTDFGRLAGEVSTQRSASAGIVALSGEVSALKTEIAEQISTTVSELRSEVSVLDCRAGLPHSQ
jgi:chromosome segregation ATPase